MRMRADIEMPSEYQGRVVSRSRALRSAGGVARNKKTLRADERDTDNDEASLNAEEATEDDETEEKDDDDDEEEEEEDSDADEDEDEDEEEVDEGVDESTQKLGNRSSKKSWREDGEEEDDEEDEVSDVEALEAAQAANVIKLVQVESKDREKAQHARNQRALSDTVLEARIRLQKPLALASRLPRGGAMHAFVQSSSRGDDSSLAQTAQECRFQARELLEEFLGLRSALWAQTPALPTPGSWATRGGDGEGEGDEMVPGGAGGKRKREEELAELWERVMAADREMETFRDATIDKWNDKVMLGSGAKSGNKFKALNQSVLTQTSHVLQDMERLVRRTRVKRSEYSVLGSSLTPELVATESAQGMEGGEEEEEEAAGGDRRRAVKELLDFEAYDDTDFYQLLLRDLIEASASTQSSELQQQLRATRREAGKDGQTP